MMRVSTFVLTAVAAVLCLSSRVDAFARRCPSSIASLSSSSSSSFGLSSRTTTYIKTQRRPWHYHRHHNDNIGRCSMSSSSSLNNNNNNNNVHEFDSFLYEGGGNSDQVVQDALLRTKTTTTTTTTSRILLPGTVVSPLEHEQQQHGRTIQMTSSSSAFPSSSSSSYANQEDAVEQREEPMLGEDAITDSDADEYDYTEQLNKIKQYDERPRFSLNEYVKNADVGDLVVTLAVPSILAFVGIRFVSAKVSNYLETRADETLDSFSNEMLYHDGDFEEMKLCKDDYARKLAWMGPKRNDAMLKRYLQVYAKKKTVSPQSISSLSYVFTLFKLSELQAADLLVALCKEMGPDKISSSGKLLFFGSRILKSPPAKAALSPIKDLIKSTYRDEKVAETLVETSQIAIAEAAYRAAVQAGGKDQQTLTVGWEVLGLDKDTATRIFEEEADEGFKTYRETMYSGQTTKYDKKGNIIDKDGKLVDPENAEGGEDDEEDEESSSVYECGNCGYTLFVAKGREFKFFGDDFECPECGAKKDQFTSRDLDDE